MSKLYRTGVISFNRDNGGKDQFHYKFRIGSYHAAKILEYIAQIPNQPVTTKVQSGGKQDG